MEIKIIFKRYDSRLELKDTNNLLVLIHFSFRRTNSIVSQILNIFD